MFNFCTAKFTNAMSHFSEMKFVKTVPDNILYKINEK